MGKRWSSRMYPVTTKSLTRSWCRKRNRKNPRDIRFLDEIHGPVDVKHFLEPPEPAGPATAAVAHSRTDWLRRMFETLLEPAQHSLAVDAWRWSDGVGWIDLLISIGLLKEPLALAVVFGVGSLGLLVGGWLMVLKTRFTIAGRALAFLGCVVAPLNLWFYHAQDLLLLDQGLWVGGVACVLLYVATVWILRDPLFMYAVEAGITLTAVLLLGNFGLAGQATGLCILLMGLALASIHAHRLFRQLGKPSRKTGSACRCFGVVTLNWLRR